MSTTTISRVRNYQGSNSFIIKMKDAINRYGGLTHNQLVAVEKCLVGHVEVKVNDLSEDLQRIAKYEGTNSFLKDIKSKLLTYGTLTDNQKSAALRQIDTEFNRDNTVNLNIPMIGETIKVGRRVGMGLKEKHGLKFNPILLDVTKVLAVSPKAVKFAGKMTIKRGSVCCICCKTLTDELSMLSGVGKICSEHVGIPYLTDKSQAETYRNEYLKKIEEIGEMDFWVPKSQIKVWDGKTEVILKMI